jgi:3-oxoacyl-[acyl-carrier-protein] synthase II
MSARGRPSVVVTGMGGVTPIGLGCDAFARGLREGDCGAAPLSRFDASAYRSQAAVEIVPDPRTEPIRAAAAFAGFQLPTRYGRAALYAACALAEALESAGLQRADLASPTCGLAFGGSTAGMPEAEGGLLELSGAADYWETAAPATFLLTPVGTTADVLLRMTGALGPLSTISTACSSATNAIGQGMLWIQAGRCDRVIVGGADALCRLTHAGFNALGLVDPERPRPFDARRQGMVIGEGAAVFVLEREELARSRGARVMGRMLGFGNVAEAHHPVQPRDDGEGAARSMQQAIEDAGLGPADVDYVNAHGTATPQNDLSEARAIHRVFGVRASQVPVSSTKSQVGHLLGASGAVELLAVLLGMRDGFLPPTSGWEQEDPELMGLDPVPGRGRPGRMAIALSNSFAFGGNNSCLVIAHPDVPQRGVAARAAADGPGTPAVTSEAA